MAFKKKRNQEKQKGGNGGQTTSVTFEQSKTSSRHEGLLEQKVLETQTCYCASRPSGDRV